MRFFPIARCCALIARIVAVEFHYLHLERPRMRIIRTRRMLLALLTLFGAGCARVQPRADFDRSREIVQQATGSEAVYDPEDARHTSEAVATLLSEGLDLRAAVHVALVNNPRIRAAFQRIGMARADVVQAGLFSNPTLGLAFKLPEGGGLTQFELNLAQNIADLWMVPARRRAAQRDLDRVILETALEASNLANDVKFAYVNALASERALEIARQNLKLVERLHDITQARLEAGTIGALDVNLARGLVLRAEVDQRNARLASSSSRRALATLLGLDGPADEIRLTGALPAPLSVAIDSTQMVEIARQSRLDLLAARNTVLAAEARVRTEYAKLFQEVDIGFELERDARRALPGRHVPADTARASIANGQLTAPEIQSRSQRRRDRSQIIDAILGPSIGVTLPVFDQNQAQIAKAKFALHEADALQDSLNRTVAQEVRDSADRVTTAWAVADLYDRQVLPQVRKTLALSESAYQAGNTPILNVIDAQRTLLEAQQANVAALQNAANALVDLERATARPASVLLRLPLSATQPAASQPATKPKEFER